MRRTRTRSLSRISALHYVKLVYRSLLFLATVAVYLLGRLRGVADPLASLLHSHWLLSCIWLVFALEMILRFFPSGLESMGCQKQFAHTYRPALPDNRPVLGPDQRNTDRRAALTALIWLLPNLGVGLLYLFGPLDAGILLLLALAYSVCDLICILFFCPFQTWLMKNKCCGSCRIYNWDYAMMFTPLAFVPNLYGWSLLALALALLVRWELTYARHPERFYERSNASLRCANCPEKLCRHKKQLRRFLQQQWELAGRRTLEQLPHIQPHRGNGARP